MNATTAPDHSRFDQETWCRLMTVSRQMQAAGAWGEVQCKIGEDADWIEIRMSSNKRPWMCVMSWADDGRRLYTSLRNDVPQETIDACEYIMVGAAKPGRK